MDMAFDGKGEIYVADTRNHRIQKFGPEGKLLTQWGAEGTVNGQFQQPRGLALDKSENVYVVDVLLTTAAENPSIGLPSKL